MSEKGGAFCKLSLKNAFGSGSTCAATPTLSVKIARFTAQSTRQSTQTIDKKGQKVNKKSTEKRRKKDKRDQKCFVQSAGVHEWLAIAVVQSAEVLAAEDVADRVAREHHCDVVRVALLMERGRVVVVVRER